MAGNETKLYFSNSNYNQIRIIEKAKELLFGYGACLSKKELYKGCNNSFDNDSIVIYNRNYLELIRKNNERIERLKTDSEKYSDVIEKLENENKDLQEKYNNSEFRYYGSKNSFGGGSLEFILDGWYYYISLDSNPFFPPTTQKIKLNENGNITGKYYCDGSEMESGKTKDIQFLNNVFDYLSDAEITENARLMIEYMLNSPISERIVEKTKKRVLNSYNSGYHFETITKCDNTEYQVLAKITY